MSCLLAVWIIAVNPLSCFVIFYFLRHAKQSLSWRTRGNACSSAISRIQTYSSFKLEL